MSMTSMPTREFLLRLHRAALPARTRRSPSINSRPHAGPRHHRLRQGARRLLGRAGGGGGRASRNWRPKWYAAGAEHMSTFYGQLAAHQLGRDAPPPPVPETAPGRGRAGPFQRPPTGPRGAALLRRPATATTHPDFLMAMADSRRRRRSISRCWPRSPSCMARVDQAIMVARRAIDAGMPLMVHGYPVTTLPAGGIAERPPALAIVPPGKRLCARCHEPRRRARPDAADARHAAGRRQIAYPVLAPPG